MKISQLPRGLKELAYQRQYENVVAGYCPMTDDLHLAFLYTCTLEGRKFWESIEDGNFTHFYNCKVINVKMK